MYYMLQFLSMFLPFLSGDGILAVEWRFGADGSFVKGVFGESRSCGFVEEGFGAGKRARLVYYGVIVQTGCSRPERGVGFGKRKGGAAGC